MAFLIYVGNLPPKPTSTQEVACVPYIHKDYKQIFVSASQTIQCCRSDAKEQFDSLSLA